MNKPTESNCCGRIFSNIFRHHCSTAAEQQCLQQPPDTVQDVTELLFLFLFFCLYLSRILSLSFGHLSRREKVQRQKRFLDEAARHMHMPHCSGSSCQHKVRRLIKLHLWDEGLQWRSAVWATIAGVIEKVKPSPCSETVRFHTTAQPIN